MLYNWGIPSKVLHFYSPVKRATVGENYSISCPWWAFVPYLTWLGAILCPIIAVKQSIVLQFYIRLNSFEYPEYMYYAW